MQHESGIELTVMLPNLENQPEFLHGGHSGNGIVYSLEVDDVEAEFGRLKEIGVEFAFEIKDEEWGQCHFIMKDLSGVSINVVQQLGNRTCKQKKCFTVR